MMVIHPGECEDVSFCGSAVYRAGVQGCLDLYNKKARIASIYWNGPCSRRGNQLEVANVNAHYIVMTGPIPSNGILGDVLVTVIAVDEDYASNR